MTRFTRTRTTVTNIGYHFIWCPKYRRPVLTSPVDIRLKELLYERATYRGWKIESLEVMHDHVHIFIKTSSKSSPQFVMNQLKGYSSRVLRKEIPSLKSRLPTLWTRSYYCESVGHISEATILRYIADQKNK